MVPHTFELLERSGFAERDLPRLRYVTQAGGRMGPKRVRHWATTGRERGWDLYVMYGQCEATARMAWLPPHLAIEHPDAVGLPVPGASIDIEDGEIVYRGPNVMLGYAEGPGDLALGRTTSELRTGDLGRITEDGLLQVVGRRARFVKVLGHRVDLDGLEQRLRGTVTTCAAPDATGSSSSPRWRVTPARRSTWSGGPPCGPAAPRGTRCEPSPWRSTRSWPRASPTTPRCSASRTMTTSGTRISRCSVRRRSPGSTRRCFAAGTSRTTHRS